MKDVAEMSRRPDFVQYVFIRPRMYTEQGSFFETVAFLKGYFSNMPGQHRHSAPWFEFLHWMQERRAEDEGRLLVHFRNTYKNDTLALQGLSELYNEFLQLHEETGASSRER